MEEDMRKKGFKMIRERRYGTGQEKKGMKEVKRKKVRKIMRESK